jgi:hypothetical protein
MFFQNKNKIYSVNIIKKIYISTVIIILVKLSEKLMTYLFNSWKFFLNNLWRFFKQRNIYFNQFILHFYLLKITDWIGKIIYKKSNYMISENLLFKRYK